MYLACNDKLIDEKKQEVEEANQGILDEYYKLPWWKRFGREGTNCQQLIVMNWLNFSNWMDKRIKTRQRVSYQLDYK